MSSEADHASSVAPPARVFLLSPARLDGRRARILFQSKTSAFAAAIRSPDGAPIGAVYRFLSGLYFRGKLAYAERFARPPRGAEWLGSGALVISQARGLVPAEARVRLDDLERFARTDLASPAFRAPFERDCRLLAEAIGQTGEVVLLGSVASDKYVAPLVSALAERLLFPIDFVGRGDMSRGGLLLRSVDAATELAYAPVLGAVRRGARPPKLVPRRRTDSR